MSAFENPQKSSLLSQPSLAEFQLPECLITVRRIEGVYGKELYLTCKPRIQTKDAKCQATALYQGLREVLIGEGGDLNSLVSETIFVADMDRDIALIQTARENARTKFEGSLIEPALTIIQQPPLDAAVCFELACQAILPKTLPFPGLSKEGSSRKAASIQKQQVQLSATDRTEDEATKAITVEMGNEKRLIAGGLCGDGDTAYQQTHSLFELAERLLQEAGMEFKHVVRTWIYLREMEQDYPELNRARREFFHSRNINPVPASTGIEGGMIKKHHKLCLGFIAIKSDNPSMRSVMTSPTLNEAGEYGADFVRGMKTVEANKIGLHVSGTASIDEQGRTAHVDDIESQIDRMILNISALLENQGASFKDIVYAYNYLKDPADEQLLRDKFKQAGFEGFPNIFVHAEVCRPDLLCETEVLAVLPV